MRLNQVTIENFRCFEHLTMDLDPELNVVVGNNGAGKTSVLDAIAIALRSELRNIESLDYVNVEDVRMRAQGAAIIDLDVDGGHRKLELIKAQSGRDPWGIWGVWKDRFDVRDSIHIYYRASRRESSLGNVDAVVEADEGSFNASTGYSESESWFYDKEVEELRLKNERKDLAYVLPDLEAVREAIGRHMVPRAKSIRFAHAKPRVLQVEWLDNGDIVRLPVSQLSDGYRNMLALVMDFARRLAQANCDSRKNPLDAKAILLIDEIELHLHPKWQQTVLGDLRRTFPNTQIIVTTHSPQILTTVESKHIRILKDGKVFTAPPATYGAEASRLLETVLGVPVRPPNNENADKIAKVHNLIIEGKIEEAERLLEELREWSQGEEPAIVDAEMAIENKKWEAELEG